MLNYIDLAICWLLNYANLCKMLPHIQILNSNCLHALLKVYTPQNFKVDQWNLDVSKKPVLNFIWILVHVCTWMNLKSQLSAKHKLHYNIIELYWIRKQNSTIIIELYWIRKIRCTTYMQIAQIKCLTFVFSRGRKFFLEFHFTNFAIAKPSPTAEVGEQSVSKPHLFCIIVGKPDWSLQITPSTNSLADPTIDKLVRRYQ